MSTKKQMIESILEEQKKQGELLREIRDCLYAPTAGNPTYGRSGESLPMEEVEGVYSTLDELIPGQGLF